MDGAESRRLEGAEGVIRKEGGREGGLRRTGEVEGRKVMGGKRKAKERCCGIDERV